MPVPKRKRSRMRRDKRFANKGMQAKPFNYCPNCQAPLTPHQACAECGHYKGTKVFESKTERAIKRGQARKAQQKAATPDVSAEQENTAE